MTYFDSHGFYITVFDSYIQATEADKPSEKRSIERKWVWAHGERGVHPGYPTGKNKGKDCDRYNKPIYTDPGVTPGVCRAYGCDNPEWYKTKVVDRVKGTRGEDSKIVREVPSSKD